LSEVEDLQRAHYDRIGADYELHYGDRWSRELRERFINRWLTHGLELEGKIVLDAMCGVGETSEHLARRGARVIGLDLSGQCIARYRRNRSGAEAVQGSIFTIPLAAASVDVVVIVGGLHHLHPNVERGIVEVHRVLKPGGTFCFMEPHAGSLLDLVRQLWYRFDRRFFERNEKSIDIERLLRKHRNLFQGILKKHEGGPAYILVLNSLVLRVPHGLKAVYSRPLMALERFMEPFFTKELSSIVICQWRKKTAPPA